MLVAPPSGNPYSYFIFAMCVLVFHFISAKLSNEQVWYSQVVVGFFFFLHFSQINLLLYAIQRPLQYWSFGVSLHRFTDVFSLWYRCSLAQLTANTTEWAHTILSAINFTFELLLKSPMKMLISIVYWKITTFGINYRPIIKTVSPAVV